MTAAELKNALKAIAEGHPIRCEDDRYIVVENPAFHQDDGSDPYIVIDVTEVADTLRNGALR